MYVLKSPILKKKNVRLSNQNIISNFSFVTYTNYAFTPRIVKFRYVLYFYL